mgnify:CR=1 FL=1
MSLQTRYVASNLVEHIPEEEIVMALTLHVLDIVDYDRRLKDFMRSVEGERLLPYVDFTRTGMRANPTIGWRCTESGVHTSCFFR